MLLTSSLAPIILCYFSEFVSNLIYVTLHIDLDSRLIQALRRKSSAFYLNKQIVLEIS